MSQVTNVRVVYERKRQPAQYESAGAQVEFFATVGDGENHKEVGSRLLGEAKTLVLTELGVVKPGEDASAAAQTAGKEAKPAKPAKETKKSPPQDEPRIGNEDDPTDHGQAPSKPAPAKAAPSNADIPDDPKPAAAKSDAKPALTAGEIQSFVAGNIKEKKIDVATVKNISREFGVERIADLKDPQLVPYKAKIDEALKNFAGTADI